MSAPLQSAAVLAVINRTERAARHERLNERRAERERSPVTWFVRRKTAETLEGAAATLSTLLAERDALRAAAVALDTALSNLWREGPVHSGHENHLGPVDDAWRDLREALAAADREVPRG